MVIMEFVQMFVEFYNLLNIYICEKSVNEASSVGVSAYSDTEPDFGNWLAGGRVRTLGSEMSGKSDAWFRNGGYTQTEFPKADPIWAGNFEDLTVFNLDVEYIVHLHRIVYKC